MDGSVEAVEPEPEPPEPEESGPESEEPPEAAAPETEADTTEPSDEVVDKAVDRAYVAAIEQAETIAVRALKKVLVDDQGLLLDGVRRSGSDAIHVAVDDPEHQAEPYVAALVPLLQDLAATLGAPLSVDFSVAIEQIHTLALDPVRQRLLEVAELSSDEDELTDTVRAVYRETRSRRLPEAVAAAVVAASGAAALATAEGPLHWVVDPAGPCGSDCADNALAGAVAAGGTYPTGDIHPPSHPACTCHLVPADD